MSEWFRRESESEIEYTSREIKEVIKRGLVPITDPTENIFCVPIVSPSIAGLLGVDPNDTLQCSIFSVACPRLAESSSMFLFCKTDKKLFITKLALKDGKLQVLTNYVSVSDLSENDKIGDKLKAYLRSINVTASHSDKLTYIFWKPKQLISRSFLSEEEATVHKPTDFRNSVVKEKEVYRSWPKGLPEGAINFLKEVYPNLNPSQVHEIQAENLVNVPNGTWIVIVYTEPNFSFYIYNDNYSRGFDIFRVNSCFFNNN